MRQSRSHPAWYLRFISLALPALASAMPVAAGSWQSARAADLPMACPDGFAKIADTARNIICRRTGTVDSAILAERLSRQWSKQARCEGRVEGLQASISQLDQSTWQISVRYGCDDS
jgi:hypothetical protein